MTSLSRLLGSSPLARGLRLRVRSHLSRNRIIPARAGFTTGAAPQTTPQSDHPRSRGVYRNLDSVCSAFAGSSPLARGLLADHRLPRDRRGIIPARAGFT